MWALAGLSVALAWVAILVVYDQQRVIAAYETDAQRLDHRRDIRRQLGGLYAEGDAIAAGIKEKLDRVNHQPYAAYIPDVEAGRHDASVKYAKWVQATRRFLTDTPDMGADYAARFFAKEGLPDIPPRIKQGELWAREIECIHIQMRRLERFIEDFKG